MKSRIRFAITLVAAVLCALPGVAVAQSVPRDSQGDQSAPIEGTWIFTIHRVVTGVTFTALQSFTAGGVTLSTGTIDRTPPPMLPPYTSAISPLYGSWSRKDDNTSVATICFFVFDPAGNAVAMIKNNLTLRLTNDNNLTGTGTAFGCNPDGGNCINANSPVTITGTRLIAQGS